MSQERTSANGLEGLLSSFLREGWSVLLGLEAAVDGLSHAQAESAADLLGILSHRLSGSAALYNLPHLSVLGSGIGRSIDGYFADAEEGQRQRRTFLRQALDRARLMFEALAAFGNEGEDLAAPLAAKYPQYFADPETEGHASTAEPAAPVVPSPEPVSPQPSPEPSTAAITDRTTEPADDDDGDDGDDAPPEEEEPEDRVVAALHLFRAHNAEVLEYFGPEAEEHIEGMAGTLAEVDEGVVSKETIDLLFRQVHTLKGAAYTVGCLPIGGLSHGLEGLLAGVREGERELSGDTLETIAMGVDVLRAMLEAVQGSRPTGLFESYSRASAALARLDAAELPQTVEADTGSAERGGSSAAAEEGASPAWWQLRDGEGDRDGDRDSDRDGEVDGEVDSLATLVPAVPVARARPLAAAAGGQATIRVSLDRLDRLMNLVGEVVVARSRVARGVERIEELGAAMSAIRGRMAQAVREFEAKHLNPNLELPDSRSRQRQAAEAEAQSADTPEAIGGTVGELFAELEWDRYDDFNILARRVGELSSDIAEVQSELDGLTHGLRDEEKTLHNLVRDLRTGVGQARMVAVGSLFGRFHRLARRLAEDEGKQVEIEISGEGTEVDNAIVEAVADPVMHLVQNAVVHGIEPGEVRLAAGKPEVGKIRLSAFAQGQFIHVEVSDDGRGLDTGMLRRRAIELGLEREDEAAALDEIGALELIYRPGFTTHAEASRAAGRGVGMDVVRNNISRINGEVRIHTEPGKGTRFSLRLPLTLLVSEALMVEVAGEVMALPLAAVGQTKMLSPAELEGEAGRQTVVLGGERMPFVRVSAALGLDAEDDWQTMPGVVVRSGGRTACLGVEDLFGIEEVVIKAVGEFFSGLDFVGGATITAEGRVILLLEPGVLATPQRADGGLASAEGTAESALASAEPATAVTPRILLVDDSLSVRKVLGSRLERAGFEVLSAVDGDEAMQLLRREDFDVLVTDLEMPRVNGYELIEDTRRRPATQELPIVVITTRAGEKHLELARRVGATRCFAKPVDERALAAHLRAITGSQAPAGRRPTIEPAPDGEPVPDGEPR